MRKASARHPAARRIIFFRPVLSDTAAQSGTATAPTRNVADDAMDVHKAASSGAAPSSIM